MGINLIPPKENSFQRHELFYKAINFASIRHRHQLRKYGETPYISHPVRVALIMSDMFKISDKHMLCAAILHDTIEDTSADYDDLLAEFGEEVADMVASLSKDKRIRESLREKAYHEKLKKASWKIKMIKIADIYDNIFDYMMNKIDTDLEKRAAEAFEISAGEKQLERPLEMLGDLLKNISKTNHLPPA